MNVTKKRSFSLCKHPAEFPYTLIIDSNHDLTFFVKNTHFELRYNTDIQNYSLTVMFRGTPCTSYIGRNDGGKKRYKAGIYSVKVSRVV